MFLHLNLMKSYISEDPPLFPATLFPLQGFIYLSAPSLGFLAWPLKEKPAGVNLHLESE